MAVSSDGDCTRSKSGYGAAGAVTAALMVLTIGVLSLVPIDRMGPRIELQNDRTHLSARER